MNQSRYRVRTGEVRESATFRLPARDKAIVDRMCEERLFVNPSEFYETAAKRLIDQMVDRYPYLAPIEADDDAA